MRRRVRQIAQLLVCVVVVAPLSGCSPLPPTEPCLMWNECLVHYDLQMRLLDEVPDAGDNGPPALNDRGEDEGWNVLFGWNADRCLYGGNLFEPNFSTTQDIREACAQTCRVNTFRAGLVLRRLGLAPGACQTEELR